MLHEMAEAPTRADARKALERFRDEFDAKYPKAVAKLDKDWEALTAFYDFPAEHWRHLRTTNPIESSFATVKLRTKVTKGAGSKKAALAMAYKLLDAAQERWRRCNGHELVADVLDGVTFKDGIKVTDDETRPTRGSPPDHSSSPNPQHLTIARRGVEVRRVRVRARRTIGWTSRPCSVTVPRARQARPRGVPGVWGGAHVSVVWPEA